MPKMCYCHQELIDVSSTRLHQSKLTSDKSCISICDVNYADEKASARNFTYLFVVIVFWNKEVSVTVVLIFPHQYQSTKKNKFPHQMFPDVSSIPVKQGGDTRTALCPSPPSCGDTPSGGFPGGGSVSPWTSPLTLFY